ncbi:MAG: type II toxin-antitoxin system VapB family antitoxin [Chloroflexi bacterium]|nr:type II toxin-antitoxin system VapB family antitoxin [Chloroflexota bacterium]
MARITIDKEDVACAKTMRRYGFATKEEAVSFALRKLAEEPMSLDEARAM